MLLLEVFEDGVPPRFRLRVEGDVAGLPKAGAFSLDTVRPDGVRQKFAFFARDGYLNRLRKSPSRTSSPP